MRRRTHRRHRHRRPRRGRRRGPARHRDPPGRRGHRPRPRPPPARRRPGRLPAQPPRPGPRRPRRPTHPLAARPELLDTLRTFLTCGLDRRRTAATLQVHPNTVDYRLRRTADLTGLDAVRGPDLLTLRAALAAHEMRAQGLGERRARVC
ncbi:helix-turn-helix domain-containing protein [Kitasatospora saccharophila]|uniref:helix-turn-helix domain-containing protein n=1 Tax=Kitasatospora saccharophila TaxID=407973 RepID=UPI0036366BC2